MDTIKENVCSETIFHILAKLVTDFLYTGNLKTFWENNHFTFVSFKFQ